MEVETQLDYRITLERQVLAGLMENPDQLYDNKADKLLRKQCFTGSRIHIYDSIIDMWQKGEPIDTITLYEKGCEASELTKVQDSHTHTDVLYHSKLLYQASARGMLDSVGNLLKTSSQDPDVDVLDALETASKALHEFDIDTTDTDDLHVRNALKSVFEAVEKVQKDGVSSLFIKTNLESFNDKWYGWFIDEYYIIAGRPGMGKTAIVLDAAKETAAQGKKPGVWSYEMSARKLGIRLLSSESGIPGRLIETATFNSEQALQLVRAREKLEKLDIYIDASQPTLQELLVKCRKMHREGKLDMIVIDYIQLMKTQGKAESREQELSTISRALRNLNLELQIPVIVLAQLNRGVEARPDKRPMMSDLRESGSLEQDADAVILLYRPEYYGIPDFTVGNNSYDSTGMAEIIVSKCRNGEPDSIPVRFVKQLTTFKDVEETFPI